MKLNYQSFNLPFRYPFTISRGTKTHQSTLIIELENFDIKGYGEAPAITYYNITVEQMMAELEAKKTICRKICIHRPGTILALPASFISKKSIPGLCTGYGCVGYLWQNERQKIV